MDEAEAFEALRTDLEKIGQKHLFESFDDASDEDAERLARQLLKLNMTTPGGLVDYCQRGKKLISELVSNAATANKEYHPPRLGEKLKANTPMFEESEELGIAQGPFTAFVLVAGGLGERLGFDKVKVSLQTDLLTGKSFLETHCEWIAAFQARAQIVARDPNLTLPFAIMTSDDTHNAIVSMLSDASKVTPGEMLGGLTDVTVLKQEKVPCFSNPRGDIALNPNDAFEVVTKPHGHGDLHSLLYKSGIVERWVARGIKWIVVFQDTNILSFRAVSAALGSCARNSLDMGMVAIQRKRGEAVGAICNVKTADGTERTLNVEYNLVNEDAFTDPSGSNNSIFPGNINLLMFSVRPYLEALRKSKGVVPEFVNPKFADKAKTEFKSPSRLECMMQDLPLSLRPEARVGYIEMERFLSFSAAKNNLKDALTKYQETGYPESVSSCENDLYSTCRRLLAMSGCQIRTAALPVRRFASLPFEDGARVVLAPSFGTTVAEIRSRFPTPHLVHISDRSSLVLEGDLIIHQLELDGHLAIRALPGARVVIKSLHVVNEGTSLENLDEDHLDQYSSQERVRGYRLSVKESLVISADEGETIIERPF